MKVPYVDLSAQFVADRDGIMADVEALFRRGDFVGGAAVAEFEAAVADYHGMTEVVAVNSGTDALVLAMYALGIGRGDEVITPPNSFVASTAAIVHIGATPVFADVLDDQNIDPDAIEAAITDKTKAIMPVHLTGRMVRMDRVMDIAEAHGLMVIEDAAQSIGSKFAGRLSGTYGDAGCFSAHPLKNLNAAGDAGFVVFKDAKAAQKVRDYRNHGLVDRNTVAQFGSVSRMDTLQAVILLRRLAQLSNVIDARRAHADSYRALLDQAHVFMPALRDDEFNTFHTFVVQVERRDALQAFLAERGIGTAIHYPVPIHLQPAAAHFGVGDGAMPVTERQASRILSLPVHQHLSQEQIAFVAETVNTFYRHA